MVVKKTPKGGYSLGDNQQELVVSAGPVEELVVVLLRLRRTSAQEVLSSRLDRDGGSRPFRVLFLKHSPLTVGRGASGQCHPKLLRGLKPLLHLTICPVGDFL